MNGVLPLPQRFAGCRSNRAGIRLGLSTGAAGIPGLVKVKEQPRHALPLLRGRKHASEG